jgi:hypothetical protein
METPLSDKVYKELIAVCLNCGRRWTRHVNGQCMFQSTHWEVLTPLENLEKQQKDSAARWEAKRKG